MDRIKLFDFNSLEDKSIFFICFRQNEKWLVDDSLRTPEQLYEELKLNVQNGDELFLYFVDEKPYGFIYLDFDRFNNIKIHGCCFNGNIFTSSRIVRNVVDYCFNKKKANKVKVETLVYQHNAEIVCKYVGFKKEGLLKDELTIYGRPVSRLLMSITKRDYRIMPKRTKKDLLEIIKKVKQNVKEK